VETTKTAANACRALTPYVVVKGAAKAIQFYVDVFGASEIYRLAEPSGKIGHAELTVGEGASQ
jgi:PhnB protein